jgi:tetratricopeptide (TPR) repeat protein
MAFVVASDSREEVMNDPSAYRPASDTSLVQLSPEIIQLAERLAENAHNTWAAQCRADGWKYGAERNDEGKEHPYLVPYSDLPESHKQHGRNAGLATIQAIYALGFQISRVSRVVWMPRAQSRIQRQDLLHQWNNELELAFAAKEVGQITVGDVFRGYANDEPSRVVLGIQLVLPETVASHIVKLGDQKVQKDLDGWKQCVLKHGVTSRVLLGVEGRPLPENRYAVIYQDAYQLFGTDPDTESPKPLELAADWAINDSKPDISSVERVFGQIFAELDRCLYQGANDGNPDRARQFYTEELQKGGLQSATERWLNQRFHQLLRRDAIWLTSARDRPDAQTLPGYLDPHDYVCWALATNQVPKTLVGRSHGDLHGRNILVGVHRGEVEQPAIFDYGDMTRSNLLVWDFVKLESELKTRILPKLASEEEARKALARAAPQVRLPVLPSAVKLSPDEQEVAGRVDRMEFAVHFEALLASLTRDIVSRDIARNARPSDQRHITGHPAIDKALGLFYRLRQEAALRLGYQMNRADRWRDEFYFALAIYGLLKAKWNIDEPQLEWALISAGVATAQLSQAGEINSLRRQRLPEKNLESPLPSHLIPLAWAHALWKEKQSGRGCQVLEDALERFPCAVTLRAEYALCLAARGDLEQASEEVNQLRPLCHVFRDHEMLSRLGRIYKDSGDAAWAGDPSQPDFDAFVNDGHPAWQLYQEAFALYEEAYEFSHHYFPGINAATLARLTGQKEAQERLVEEVITICRATRVADLEERFWVYATEGEAWLLRGDSAEALRFYRAALATPPATQLGMVQALYNQLCRLAWALGRSRVQAVIEELDKRGMLAQLEPGPFGDCSLQRTGKK